MASNPEEELKRKEEKKRRRRQGLESTGQKEQDDRNWQDNYKIAFLAASYSKEEGTYQGRPVLEYICDQSRLVARLEKENQELRSRVFSLELAVVEKDTLRPQNKNTTDE